MPLRNIIFSAALALLLSSASHFASRELQRDRAQGNARLCISLSSPPQGADRNNDTLEKEKIERERKGKKKDRKKRRKRDR